MSVTIAVMAVVGFPIILLMIGAIWEFRKNRAASQATVLDTFVVIGFMQARHKGQHKYKKAKVKYDVLKNLEK